MYFSNVFASGELSYKYVYLVGLENP